MEVVKRESQPTLDTLRQIAIQAADVKHQLYDLDQEKKRAEDLVSRTKQGYGFIHHTCSRMLLIITLAQS